MTIAPTYSEPALSRNVVGTKKVVVKDVDILDVPMGLRESSLCDLTTQALIVTYSLKNVITLGPGF